MICGFGLLYRDHIADIARTLASTLLGGKNVVSQEKHRLLERFLACGIPFWVDELWLTVHAHLDNWRNSPNQPISQMEVGS